MANETVAGEQDDFDAEFAAIIAGTGDTKPAPKVNDGATVSDHDEPDTKGEEEAKRKAAEEAEKATRAANLQASDADKKAAEEKAAAEKAEADKVAADKAAADEAALVAKMNEAEKAKYEEEKAAKQQEADEKARTEADEKVRKEANVAANKKRTEEEKTRKEAEDKARKEAEDKARKEANEKAALVDELTPEEKEAIAAFEKEWPDQAKVMRVMMEKASAKMDKKYALALQSVLEQVYGDIKPVAANAAELSAQSHFNTIRAKHPDFDSIHANIPAWIETQPPYLAETLNKVYTAGNAEEVIDLVQRYKDANGIATPQPGTKPKPSPTPVDRKKVEALTPVNSGRTTPQQRQADANDFDAGFAEAAAIAEASGKK